MRAERILLLILCLFVAAACGEGDPAVRVAASHGSAAIVRPLVEAYEARFPDRPIRARFDDGVTLAAAVAAGTESADLVVLDDAALFGDLLQPAWTDFHLRFGRDRVVLAGTPGTAGALDPAGAPDLASAVSGSAHPLVIADPSVAAAGYHALATIRLLDGAAGTTLEQDLASEGAANLSLPALIESVLGSPSLTLLPRSVALAAGLDVRELGDEINLGEPHLGPLYARAAIEAAGTPRRPATVIHFGVSLPSQGPRRGAALGVLEFLLGPEGIALTVQAGLQPVRGQERMVGFGVPVDIDELLAATATR